MNLIVQATCPAATAHDVTEYELSYAIDGAAPIVVTSHGEPLTFPAPTGSTVVATFVEINSSGVRSEPSDPASLVVLSTVAPPKPGPFELTVIGPEAPAEVPPTPTA